MLVSCAELSSSLQPKSPIVRMVRLRRALPSAQRVSQSRRGSVVILTDAYLPLGRQPTVTLSRISASLWLEVVPHSREPCADSTLPRADVAVVAVVEDCRLLAWQQSSYEIVLHSCALHK